VTLAAVSDAGPLIHLAEIDSLELLSRFDTLLVPETVYEEVDVGGVPDGGPTSRTNSSKPTKAESELRNWTPENAPRLRSQKSVESFFYPTTSPRERQHPRRASKYAVLSASSRSGVSRIARQRRSGIPYASTPA
jgi:hypothetical protein